MNDFLDHFIPPDLVPTIPSEAESFALENLLPNEPKPSLEQVITAHAIFQENGINAQQVINLLSPDMYGSDARFGCAFVTGDMPAEAWDSTLTTVLSELRIIDRPRG